MDFIRNLNLFQNINVGLVGPITSINNVAMMLFISLLPKVYIIIEHNETLIIAL